MERILEQAPRFFSWNNMLLLVDAAGVTLAMTVVGCLIGFGLAFVLVFLRQTPGLWAAPLRLLCIAYVETFRRIPFLVVTYLVLFFIQALVSDASLFTVAVTAICIYAIAYTAEIIRASAPGSSSPASGVAAARSGSPKFVTTSSIPQRLATATPFHRPSP